MPHIHPASNEEIEREAVRWVAIYEDGTQLSQFDDEGVFHQFKEIDQSRLHVFKLVHDERPDVTILFPKGAKLIHAYQNDILDHGSDNERFVRTYKAGYEVNGETVLVMIPPSGEVIITDHPRKVAIS